MEAAKIRLERDGQYEVVGGILSPTHDHYGVLQKPSLLAANGQHRVNMVRLATQSSRWMGSSDFEVTLDRWTRTFVVMQAYSMALQSYFAAFKPKGNSHELHVLLACGADWLDAVMMKPTGINTNTKAQEIILSGGMIVQERDGSVIDEAYLNQVPLVKKYKDRIITFNKTARMDISTFSSTIVRELVKENKSIQYLVMDDVVRYIDDHNLYR